GHQASVEWRWPFSLCAVRPAGRAVGFSPSDQFLPAGRADGTSDKGTGIFQITTNQGHIFLLYLAKAVLYFLTHPY
ncbi:hypothetical protein, partial [Amphritea pacifica]